MQDVTVLVINEIGDEEYCDDIENYLLPVLQDTTEDAVFETWGAQTYDLFAVDRNGRIAYSATSVHPGDEGEYNELLRVIPTI